jgi:hypothetical protein
MDQPCTIIIPWEPDVCIRTVWHPKAPTGTFSTLSRGHFDTKAEAQTWADRHLGPKATYTIVNIADLPGTR